MTDNFALWLAISAGALAVIYGAISARWIVKQPAGNERMQEIAQAIQEGANAYMNRQYYTIGLVGVVLFVLLAYFIDLPTGIGFAIGAVFFWISWIYRHVCISSSECKNCRSC